MKPSSIKKLEGNRSKRPISEGPDYPSLDASPPDYLDDRATTEWERLYPILSANGVVTEADQWLLASYCQHYSDWIRLTLALRDDGDILDSRNGEKKNPLFAVRAQVHSALLAVAQQLGFSPQSRQRIATGRTEGDPDDLDSLANDYGRGDLF